MVSVGSVTVTETQKNTTVTVPVTLSTAATSTVTVLVRLGGGTASAGSDYTAWTTDAKVTFAPGQTSQTVSVVVVGDGVAESDETVLLTLLSPVNATLGTTTGTLTVKDDDSRLVAAAVGPATTAALDLGTARHALSTARAYWLARGADAHRLAAVTLRVTPMTGTDLAQAVGTTVLVDADAAGWGWGRVDLYAVLVHELGHVLGLGHTAGGVMSEDLAGVERALSAGVPARRHLAAAPVPVVAPVVNPVVAHVAAPAATLLAAAPVAAGVAAPVAAQFTARVAQLADVLPVPALDGWVPVARRSVPGAVTDPAGGLPPLGLLVVGLLAWAGVWGAGSATSPRSRRRLPMLAR
jgi:hypothetical protein